MLRSQIQFSHGSSTAGDTVPSFRARVARHPVCLCVPVCRARRRIVEGNQSPSFHGPDCGSRGGSGNRGLGCGTCAQNQPCESGSAENLPHRPARTRLGGRLIFFGCDWLPSPSLRNIRPRALSHTSKASARTSTRRRRRCESRGGILVAGASGGARHSYHHGRHCFPASTVCTGADYTSVGALSLLSQCHSETNYSMTRVASHTCDSPSPSQNQSSTGGEQ